MSHGTELRYVHRSAAVIPAAGGSWRVDFNANKTMDRDEFLRLMRLQRETTLAAYTAAYARNRLYAIRAAPPSEVSRVLEATLGWNLGG
eukprot:Skav230204  [mRNA]  locus=scaffold2443:173584:175657:+ [translate_table: standard]